MNYQPLHDILPAPLLFLVMIGAFAGVAITSFTGFTVCLVSAFSLYHAKRKNKPAKTEADKLDKSDIKSIAWFTLLASVGAFLLIFCGGEFIKQNNSMMQNESIASENLKSKYSLNNVDWHAGQSQAGALSETPRDLLVEDTQGRKVIFKYAVNPSTSEPTLSELGSTDEPIKSGTEHITVESILNH